MAVAVTGASGLLGRVVAAALSPDRRVIAIDRVAGPEKRTRVADLRDLEATVRAFAGADAVVHLAAIDGARSAGEEDFIQTNTMACWNALKAAEMCGIRKFVLCSSIAAVGLGPGHPPACLPVPVDHLRAPVSAYGISKHLGEILAEAFARRGAMDVVCLRPCFIVFPHLISEVALRSAASDGVAPPPRLRPSGVAMTEPLAITRSFVSPEDVARAAAAALNRMPAGFSVFFVTGPSTTSSRPTAELAAAVWGKPPPIAEPSLYARNPHAGMFDIGAARARLGWEPRDDWASLLARVTEPG